MRIIDDAFAAAGYVLDFSNTTFSEFFEDELAIEIYGGKYDFKGSSKANHLRAFVEVEGPQLVSRALRALWKYREDLPDRQSDSVEHTKQRLFDLLGRIEAGLPTQASIRPQQAWTAEEQKRRRQLTTYLEEFSEDAITEKLLLPLCQQLWPTPSCNAASTSLSRTIAIARTCSRILGSDVGGIGRSTASWRSIKDIVSS